MLGKRIAKHRLDRNDTQAELAKEAGVSKRPLIRMESGGSAWTSLHQMSMNRRRDGFTRADFREFAATASMKRGRADEILDAVIAAVYW